MRHFATLCDTLGESYEKKTKHAIWVYTGLVLLTYACFLAWGATGGMWVLGLFALVEGLTTYERENEWFKIWYDDDD